MLFPATGLATVGHCLLGAPADLIDWSCRRLWTEQPDPVTQFDATPLDAVELGLGAILIEGPVEAPANLFEAFVYEGGPGSYFSQNDALLASVTFIR